MSTFVHLTGPNREQDRFSMARSDLHGHFCFRGQMNVMPLHLLQTALPNGFEKSLRCSVVENRRRDPGFILQIDFHGNGPLNNYTWTTSIFFEPRPDCLLMKNEQAFTRISRAGPKKHKDLKGVKAP